MRLPQLEWFALSEFLQMSNRVLKFINDERFPELFITELGWSMPKGMASVNVSSEQDGETYPLVPVANYRGLTAWVCRALPKRAVRTEIGKVLSNRFSDFVLIFTNGENQVWSWPSINETRVSFRRLTAQHHRVGDKNDALARRVDRFKVDPARSMSAAGLLIAVKNGFDTDTEAALRIADLHSKLLSAGMNSTDIEILLTRLLFLFFGEDTDLFARGPYDASVTFEGTVAGGDEFRNLILRYPDGEGFDQVVLDLFAALSTPIAERHGLRADVLDFPYVNGGLFQDVKPVPRFDQELTDLVLACSNLDWSDISPAIFGSMFEGLLESTIEHVVNSDEGYAATRRQLGAHYTSEENILRVIRPLFLDELQEELTLAATNPRGLEDLHSKISSLTFFDPACGCGNFLVVTYKELREIENEILSRLLESGDIRPEDVPSRMNVKIDQFFGIEISKSASAVAQVALWITDHQQNVETYALLGAVRHSIPLTETPGIVRGDALALPWEVVIRPEDCDFIIGNPPYLGKGNQSRAQKAQLVKSIQSAAGKSGITKIGKLDFIAGWFVKAVKFATRAGEGGQRELQLFESVGAWGESEHDFTKIDNRLRGTLGKHRTQIAFVATNSICQGEQVPILWPWIFEQGFVIRFAHRTFKWSNNNPGAANVFCVVIGLDEDHSAQRVVFDYSRNVTGNGERISVSRINAYLVDARDVFIEPRSASISGKPAMSFGNQPIDGGNLMLTEMEREHVIRTHPGAANFVRPYLGADEFLNNKSRYCLWFEGMSLGDVEALLWPIPYLDRVRKMRLASDRAETRELAETPHLFAFVSHRNQPFLFVPGVSSEDRQIVPIGFLPADVVASNAAFTVPGVTLADFAIMTSSMHNAWMRATSGRLKGDYRYSATLTYNTFPWPELDGTDKGQLEVAAQLVLDARASHPDLTLAKLYSPKSMPAALLEAHGLLDHAVDRIYGYSSSNDDLSRLAFLFPVYEQLAGNKTSTPRH